MCFFILCGEKGLNPHSLPEASCANLLLQSAFVSKLTSAACNSPRGLLRNPHKLPLAPCSKLLHLSVSVSKLTSPARCKIFAERRGFEPRKHFWRLHAFQACLFNHSSISPSRFFANRVQKYCFFRKYARVCAFFCVFFRYFMPKRRFALLVVAVIISSAVQSYTSANLSATYLISLLSLRCPRCGTGAI